MHVVPLLIPFWVHVWSISGSILAPKSVPNLVPKNKIQVICWNLFSGLKPLQVPLESRLEPLMLVLRPPKTRKVLFYHCKISFFANVAFRYFEALEDLLGRMLALLGPF